jgi:LEA14-like dessication related protein
MCGRAFFIHAWGATRCACSVAHQGHWRWPERVPIRRPWATQGDVRTLLLVVSTLAAGCSKPSPPTLAPEKVGVNRVDMTGLSLDISMSATNPNAVDLTATGVSSHVVVEKAHDIGTVTLPEAITLPAGKTTRLDVPLALTWSDLGTLAQLALSADEVPYTIDGTLEVGGNLLHVGVPFHFDGTITHAQIVAAMMNSLPVPR